MSVEGWQCCSNISTKKIFKVNFKNLILLLLLVIICVKVRKCGSCSDCEYQSSCGSDNTKKSGNHACIKQALLISRCQLLYWSLSRQKKHVLKDLMLLICQILIIMEKAQVQWILCQCHHIKKKKNGHLIKI